MFKFADISHNNEVNNIDLASNIKGDADSNMSLNDAIKFWDNKFDDAPKISMSDILGKKEEDFSFDNFDASEARRVFHNFDDNYWKSLSKNEKIDLISSVIDILAEMLKIKDIPNLEIFTDNPGTCGYYLSGLNMVGINKQQLKDPRGLLNTIAHELWHAYQEERALNPKTKMDYKYQANIENYVKPIYTKDGNCILFTDYQDQLVEAEARAFAKKISG